MRSVRHSCTSLRKRGQRCERAMRTFADLRSSECVALTRGWATPRPNRAAMKLYLVLLPILVCVSIRRVQLTLAGTMADSPSEYHQGSLNFRRLCPYDEDRSNLLEVARCGAQRMLVSIGGVSVTDLSTESDGRRNGVCGSEHLERASLPTTISPMK